MPFYPFYLLQYYAKVKSSDNLNNWQTPTNSYQSFLTGMTEMYDTAPGYSKHYADFITRYFQEGISGSSSTSGSSVYVTGGTANGANSTLIFNNSSGGSFTVTNSALLFNDAFVSGGTLNPATGVVTFINTTGGTFEVSGFDGFSSYWSANTNGSISNSGLTNINVGIGTITPNEELTVLGSISASTSVLSPTLSSTTITASGTITAEQITSTDDITASGDYFSGTTNLLDIFASSAITNQDVYWSANTNGSISNSGLTNINVGIGTITPNEELTVLGSISASTSILSPLISGVTLSASSNVVGATVSSTTTTTTSLVVTGDTTIGGNLAISGGGENYIAGDLNMWDADIIIPNNHSVKFENTAGTEFANIKMNTSNDMIFQNAKTNGDILIRAGGSQSGNTVFTTNGAGTNTEIMRLVGNDAYVGIGTITPNEKLTVSGTVSASTSVLSPTVSAVTITSSGNVFVGNVDAAGAGYSENKILVAQSTGQIEYLTTAQLKQDIGDADYWSANTNGSISNSGLTNINVGIGTQSPGEKLEVYANGADVAIKIHEDAGTHQAKLHLRRGGSDWEIINDNHLIIEGEGTERFRISTGGNIGINTTTPEAKLTIKSDPGDTNQPTRITNSSTDAHTGLFLNGTGNATSEKYGMQFGGYNQYSIGGVFGVLDSTGGSTSGDITIDFANGTSAGALIEKVRFTHEGNVGVGTSDPNENLTVVGSVSATTNLYFREIVGGTF